MGCEVLAVHGGYWQPALGVQLGLPTLQTRQERGLGELLGQPGAGRGAPRPWLCRQAGTTPCHSLRQLQRAG